MGNSRPAATAAELLEVLKNLAPIRKGQAMPYIFAAREMRRVMHTSTRKAMEWMDTAAKEEPHEFEILGAASGTAWHVARGNGTFLRLDEAGYSESSDPAFWPQLSSGGQFVAAKYADTDLNREFVVLSKDLKEACEHAESFRKKAIESHRRAQEASIEGAEKAHGDALSFFRGLLKMAGVERISEKLSVGHYEKLRVSFTTMNLTLSDADIDAVAGVLQAFGIEQEPPTQIVTRAPEAADSV